MAKKTKKNIQQHHRAQQKDKQDKLMKRLTWWTIGAVLVLIIVLIWASPKSSSASFPYDKLPVLGKTDAAVKIVEFGDYKCPVCQTFSQQIEPQLKKDFIDTGRVSFYFMNFAFIGPDSTTAALAAQSVVHQNKDAFWPFHHALYNSQGDERTTWATPDFLVDLAQKNNIQIDIGKLKQDIDVKTYQQEVADQNAFAENHQVNGTPTLFINGKKFEDVFNYEALKTAIEEAAKGGK